MPDPSQPDDLSDIPDPTLEQLLPTMYISDRQCVESKDFPWAQREAIIEFYRKQYKEGQRRERDKLRQKQAATTTFSPSSDTPDWVNSSDAMHLSLEGEAMAEPSPGAPESDDGEAPSEKGDQKHPITPRVREEIESQDKWGVDWPQKSEPKPDLAPEKTHASFWERTKSWLKRNPGWVFVGGAMALAGVGEYLVAEAVLLFAFVAFAMQIHEWSGHGNRPWIARSLKALWFIGVVFMLMYFGAIFYKQGTDKGWTNLWQRDPSAQAPPSPSNTPDTQQLLNEFRAESSRPIRDVAFHVKLNRKYSIQELGHFRIIYEIFENNTLDFFIACQDLYKPNESLSPNANVYGYRCTVHYRTSKTPASFTAIPVYGPSGPKYTSLLTRDFSVDVMEWKIDLYNQIPSYKTVEDLNRKYLYIFVTESLTDKISEVSFDVNNWELASAKSSRLIFSDDRPIASWFLPLTENEKSIKWRGIYLREPEEFSKRYPDFSGRPWVWPLDFALLSPKKLPEPDVKLDALK